VSASAPWSVENSVVHAPVQVLIASIISCPAPCRGPPQAQHGLTSSLTSPPPGSRAPVAALVRLPDRVGIAAPSAAQGVSPPVGQGWPEPVAVAVHRDHRAITR